MKRPTCGTCPSFDGSPGGGCRLEPPRVQILGAAPPAFVGGQPQLQIACVIPQVTAETPACSHHPAMKTLVPSAGWDSPRANGRAPLDVPRGS